uniref:ATPase AAA-type core domain-containing protein n=1 Tax=Chlorobium chlorochromatii (strain CaD3) TaxID=340177 RepID=Q3ANU4_CHLCH
MLQKLIIKRFRGFSTLEVDIPKVLLLMGPNSSGKTTALHAIRISCQAAWIAVTNNIAWKVEDTVIIFKDFIIRDISQLMPIADWQALFVNQIVGEHTHFSIEIIFEKTDALSSILIEGKYARNENLKITATIGAETLINNLKNISNRSSQYKNIAFEFFQKHLPKAILIPPFYGVIRDEEYRAKAVVDAMVGSADQSHVVRNMISRLSTTQLEQLNAFIKDMVGATLVQRTQGDDIEKISPLRVTFRDTNGELELSAAGAGLINLIALYSSLARWESETIDRQIIFLLDEPEAHLHPRLQGYTADRLATIITNDFNAQLIMATHSIEIINKIGERDDATIFRTDRLNKEKGGQQLIGQTPLLDDLSQWADLTPFSIINFLASKRILFYEGKSDGIILTKCAEILFRNNPDKKKKFEKWTLIQLEGSGNKNIAQLLAHLIDSSTFASVAEKKDFKIVVQLDKDYNDEVEQLKLITNRDISTFYNIWSKHSIESLFCESATLYQWLKPKYPDIQEETIEKAIIAANQDNELNQYAREQRQATLLKPLQKISENITATNRQADNDIAATPEIWQRGKDRSKVILHHIKTALSTSANSLSTSLTKVIEKADVNLFPAGNRAVVPSEIKQLLDWMVTNA